MTTWNDFAASGLGPELPLTSGQRVQLPSGLFPSGESNFADLSQSNINQVFPSPPEFITTQPGQSGIYTTYPELGGTVNTSNSGIFHYNNLSGIFSDATKHDPSGIQDFSFSVSTSLSGIYDFTQSNMYIHYYTRPAPPTALNPNGIPVKIPFINDASISVTYNPYGQG